MIEIMEAVRDTIAASPDFIAEIDDVGVDPLDRIFFLRNDIDLPASMIKERPFVVVDIPKLNWIQGNAGDRCPDENSSVSMVFGVSADPAMSVDDDTTRVVTYLTNVLRYLFESSPARIQSLTEASRPYLPPETKRAGDGVNDYWHSAYMINVSV